ncbi:MAG: hypothetical protein J7647_32520 [Cyanobacteria bacterium SBLK]|nr:hypothetical protein [Cyanobacteria bacterium SBLK]
MLSNKTEANELKKITRKINLEFVSSSVLFAMSHGTSDSLRFREGESALSIDDAKLLAKSSAYAFACYRDTDDFFHSNNLLD